MLQTDNTSCRLFLYGSLCSDEFAALSQQRTMSHVVTTDNKLRKQAQALRSLLRKHGFYEQLAYCKNGFLVDAGGYPGLVLGVAEHDQVAGELFVVEQPELVFPHLDAYEECSLEFPQPTEYVREKIIVYGVESKKAINAWTYLYNWPIEHRLQNHLD